MIIPVAVKLPWKVWVNHNRYQITKYTKIDFKVNCIVYVSNLCVQMPTYIISYKCGLLVAILNKAKILQFSNKSLYLVKCNYETLASSN